MLKSYILYITCFAWFFSNTCIAQKNSPESSYGETLYREDLSSLRPPVGKRRIKKRGTQIDRNTTKQEFTHTVNAQVDQMLDNVRQLRIEKNNGFIQGYTIRIYFGTNRQHAIAAKSKMVTNLKKIKQNQEDDGGIDKSHLLENRAIRMQYDQPNFRVVVGEYYTTLEAQSDLVHIKKQFPNAILIPEKIPFLIPPRKE